MKRMSSLYRCDGTDKVQSKSVNNTHSLRLMYDKHVQAKEYSAKHPASPSRLESATDSLRGPLTSLMSVSDSVQTTIRPMAILPVCYTRVLCRNESASKLLSLL